jgi:hypothetical protein
VLCISFIISWDLGVICCVVLFWGCINSSIKCVDFLGTIVTRFSVIPCKLYSILCAASWLTRLRLTILASITNYTHWPTDLPLRTGRIRVLNGAAVQRAIYIKSINSTQWNGRTTCVNWDGISKDRVKWEGSQCESYVLRHVHEVSSLSGWAHHDVTVTELSSDRVEGKREPQSDHFPLIRWCRKITIMVLAVINEHGRF